MSKNIWEGRWQGRSPLGDVHTRARTIVRPSGGIVRGKFPSRKNGRMVHYEGLLELHAIYLFETSLRIVRYREQPRTYNYPDGEKLLRYTPDFELLLVTGEMILVEVKPDRFFNEEKTHHKFNQIKEYLRRSHISFVNLNEHVIRQEPRLSLLRWIFHQADRVPPTLDLAAITLRNHYSSFPTTIGNACALLLKNKLNPFSLLLIGLLRCPLSSTVSMNIQLTLTTETDHEWFWIAQEYNF